MFQKQLFLVYKLFSIISTFSIKVPFFILHHFPVVLLPLCLPVVTYRDASPGPTPGAPWPRLLSVFPPMRARALAEPRLVAPAGRLVALGWEPRPPRHHGGITTGNNTTGEKERDNDAK